MEPLHCTREEQQYPFVGGVYEGRTENKNLNGYLSPPVRVRVRPSAFFSNMSSAQQTVIDLEAKKTELRMKQAFFDTLLEDGDAAISRAQRELDQSREKLATLLATYDEVKQIWDTELMSSAPLLLRVGGALHSLLETKNRSKLRPESNFPPCNFFARV
ncbi:hypothetical protein TELCIR_19515 [Teladorsagia circumcincta]|uniref:Uncharacterized protein n=1 Tax=Teladorsagia circumcincta TaxID=45464 RepID=A0A2G9TM11_TELCI|nr:hypothetical protein TELCIR_19515 [Teladorsagia circumcincta]